MSVGSGMPDGWTRDKRREEMRSLLGAFGDSREHGDTPPWSRSVRIVCLVNDTDLLRRHFDSIAATIVAANQSPKYWVAIKQLLNFPAPNEPADPTAVPNFSVSEAKAYRSQPKTDAIAPNPEKPRDPLWPKMRKQRDQMLAAMKAFASSAGMPEMEMPPAAADLFPAMGTQFGAGCRGLRKR